MRIVIGSILVVMGTATLMASLIGAGLFGLIGTEAGISRAQQQALGCVIGLAEIAIGLVAITWNPFRSNKNSRQSKQRTIGQP